MLEKEDLKQIKEIVTEAVEPLKRDMAGMKLYMEENFIHF
jgi:hypothetical protein